MELIVTLVILIVIGAIVGSTVTSSFAAAALFTIFFALGGLVAIPTFVSWLIATWDREGRLPGTLFTIFCLSMCVLIAIL